MSFKSRAKITEIRKKELIESLDKLSPQAFFDIIRFPLNIIHTTEMFSSEEIDELCNELKKHNPVEKGKLPVRYIKLIGTIFLTQNGETTNNLYIRLNINYRLKKLSDGFWKIMSK